MAKHIKFNEEVPFPEGTEEFADDIATAIRMRVQATALEAEAKTLKAKANKLAMIALPILQRKRVMSNLGGVTLYDTTRNTVDNDGVKHYLIEKGVSPRMLTAAYKHNTKSKTTQSVRFLKPE